MAAARVQTAFMGGVQSLQPTSIPIASTFKTMRLVAEAAVHLLLMGVGTKF